MYFRLAWRSSLAARAQAQSWSHPVYARMFTSSSVRGEEDKQEKIIRLLREKFEPSDLQVQDVSGGCGSFFAIMIKSKAFADKRTVQSHRMVNQAIKDVFQDIHGLQLKTIADKD
ncbi:hypothetical protein MCAP1_002660 [Malassezia caprae]|uniref:Uncharacterized protein n=1 Tax=Malassezia caprae TaxID=1381934 RepID=A0AAF0ECS7_9BASI|nr:hypothetical protein MCAP1_002660 [Malassezia caprae]